MSKRKMFFLTIIAITTILTGCSRPIQPWELEKAQTICKEHKGIYSLEVYSNFGKYLDVICNDGTKKHLKH